MCQPYIESATALSDNVNVIFCLYGLYPFAFWGRKPAVLVAFPFTVFCSFLKCQVVSFCQSRHNVICVSYGIHHSFVMVTFFSMYKPVFDLMLTV